MDNIFLIFGYGVPKNIIKDEKYNFYLKMVFNRIYDISVRNKTANPLIIFSGGKTDCYKPYKRSEADEMIRFFKSLCGRFSLKKTTKNWLLLSEKRSLSTLENFLYCKEKILKRKIDKANINIFCEQTRENRVKKLSKLIFNKNYKCRVVPIDFDISLNRYLDPKFIVEKERKELEHNLWAIKNPENLKEHHKFFKEKFEFLRKCNPDRHAEAVKKYWEKKLGEIKK